MCGVAGCIPGLELVSPGLCFSVAGALLPDFGTPSSVGYAVNHRRQRDPRALEPPL